MINITKNRQNITVQNIRSLKNNHQNCHKKRIYDFLKIVKQKEQK